MKMYGILNKARFDGATLLLLSDDVERDAVNANMTIQEYIRETERINPQFRVVYTV